jgi:hypothetical protein
VGTRDIWTQFDRAQPARAQSVPNLCSVRAQSVPSPPVPMPVPMPMPVPVPSLCPVYPCPVREFWMNEKKGFHFFQDEVPFLHSSKIHEKVLRRSSLVGTRDVRTQSDRAHAQSVNFG